MLDRRFFEFLEIISLVVRIGEPCSVPTAATIFVCALWELQFAEQPQMVGNVTSSLRHEIFWPSFRHSYMKLCVPSSSHKCCYPIAASRSGITSFSFDDVGSPSKLVVQAVHWAVSHTTADTYAVQTKFSVAVKANGDLFSEGLPRVSGDDEMFLWQTVTHKKWTTAEGCGVRWRHLAPSTTRAPDLRDESDLAVFERRPKQEVTVPLDTRIAFPLDICHTP